MYFSITFENASHERKNTWDDWGLIPTSPPMVDPPEMETNYVTIPGREEGPIDLSEIPGGRPTFKNIETEWDFVLTEDSPSRMELFEEMKTFLHGKQMSIYLEEESGYGHTGRVFVTTPRTGRGLSTIGVKCTLSPARFATN